MVLPGVDNNPYAHRVDTDKHTGGPSAELINWAKI